jgi:hypothetical protein
VLVNFTVRWIDKLRLLADGDVTDEVATIPVGARSWLIVSEMPASTEFESSTGQGNTGKSVGGTAGQTGRVRALT